MYVHTYVYIYIYTFMNVKTCLSPFRRLEAPAVLFRFGGFLLGFLSHLSGVGLQPWGVVLGMCFHREWTRVDDLCPLVFKRGKSCVDEGL